MELEIDKIPESGKSFAHTYTAGDLSLEDAQTRFVSDTQVTARAVRKNNEVRLQGQIKTAVEVLCDRCLKSVNVEIDTPFEATYVPIDGDTVGESTELQENDLNSAPLEGDAVNVDQLVCEQVLLALPSRSLCNSECRGLCASCGTDLNLATCNCEKTEVDARWAALAALKQNQ